MPRRRSGKKIDTVHWELSAGLNAAGFAAGTIAVNAFAAQHLPETLLRMRGEISCLIDANQAPGVSALIAMGIIQVPEGTGTTVLWSPLTDGDAPWIWMHQGSVAYEEMVTDVICVQEMLSFRAMVDSKAMRIIRNRELQFVAENITVQGAVSVNIIGRVRALAGS